jgi:hypothetical protein
MSFEYKNPTSGTLVQAPNSVDRETDTGTIFSVNSIGGYMEVWSLADLDWIIPNETYTNGGPVDFSGNVIPISFISAAHSDPPPYINQLNLNNDGISSGRRRLGMLVFVQENLKHINIQYQIMKIYGMQQKRLETLLIIVVQVTRYLI